MRKHAWMVNLAAAGLVGAAGSAWAGEGHEHPAGHEAAMPKAEATQDEAEVTPYPLDYCPVSGEKLGGEMGEPFVMVYEGREVKFCCKGCVKDFKKDPEKFLAKIDTAVEAQEDEKASTDMPQAGTHEKHSDHPEGHHHD
jgi:YHS domain-containing protein